MQPNPYKLHEKQLICKINYLTRSITIKQYETQYFIKIKNILIN